MRHVLVIVSSLALVLGALYRARPWLEAKQLEANERQAIADLLVFQAAEVDFASGVNMRASQNAAASRSVSIRGASLPANDLGHDLHRRGVV
jgi:hypothetical protein